jgi:hypothetical protein
MNGSDFVNMNFICLPDLRIPSDARREEILAGVLANARNAGLDDFTGTLNVTGVQTDYVNQNFLPEITEAVNQSISGEYVVLEDVFDSLLGPYWFQEGVESVSSCPGERRKLSVHSSSGRNYMRKEFGKLFLKEKYPASKVGRRLEEETPIHLDTLEVQSSNVMSVQSANIFEDDFDAAPTDGMGEMMFSQVFTQSELAVKFVNTMAFFIPLMWPFISGPRTQCSATFISANQKAIDVVKTTSKTFTDLGMSVQVLKSAAETTWGVATDRDIPTYGNKPPQSGCLVSFAGSPYSACGSTLGSADFGIASCLDWCEEDGACSPRNQADCDEAAAVMVHQGQPISLPTYVADCSNPDTDKFCCDNGLGCCSTTDAETGFVKTASYAAQDPNSEEGDPVMKSDLDTLEGYGVSVDDALRGAYIAFPDSATHTNGLKYLWVNAEYAGYFDSSVGWPFTPAHFAQVQQMSANIDLAGLVDQGAIRQFP